MTSEGLGEMFEGDSADMCAGKFPLMSMGGRAEGLGCRDPEARTPIGASGNFTCGGSPIYCKSGTAGKVMFILVAETGLHLRCTMLSHVQVGGVCR